MEKEHSEGSGELRGDQQIEVDRGEALGVYEHEGMPRFPGKQVK